MYLHDSLQLASRGHRQEFMLQVLETWSFSKVLSDSKKRVAPAGVSTLQGPGENE
jgi:hypothetical protein